MDTMSQPLATTLAVMTPAEVAALLRQFNGWRRDFEDKFEQPDPHEVSEAIDAAVEMIERLEAAEEDRSNFIVEMGRLCAQCDALRAKIEAMGKQEPVAWLHESRRDSDVVTSAVKHVWGKAAVGSMAAYSIPLYLAPGAQPAPSIPEGWKPVPIEPTETMIGEGSCASSLPGPHYISEGCAQQCWKYMIAAAPEAKP